MCLYQILATHSVVCFQTFGFGRIVLSHSKSSMGCQVVQSLAVVSECFATFGTRGYTCSSKTRFILGVFSVLMRFSAEKLSNLRAKLNTVYCLIL